MHITDTLVKSRLVSKVMIDNEHATGFHPAKDIADISFAEALEKIDTIGENKIFINKDGDFESINKSLDDFSTLLNDNYSKLFIKDL